MVMLLKSSNSYAYGFSPSRVPPYAPFPTPVSSIPEAEAAMPGSPPKERSGFIVLEQDNVPIAIGSAGAETACETTDIKAAVRRDSDTSSAIDIGPAPGAFKHRSRSSDKCQVGSEEESCQQIGPICFFSCEFLSIFDLYGGPLRGTLKTP